MAAVFFPQGILNYMADSLKQIEEAWESVLLEMDCKLDSFAQKLPEDGMATEFLELLMFGVPSPELESFLQVSQNRVDFLSRGRGAVGQSVERPSKVLVWCNSTD